MQNRYLTRNSLNYRMNCVSHFFPFLSFFLSLVLSHSHSLSLSLSSQTIQTVVHFICSFSADINIFFPSILLQFIFACRVPFVSEPRNAAQKNVREEIRTGKMPMPFCPTICHALNTQGNLHVFSLHSLRVHSLSSELQTNRPY